MSYGKKGLNRIDLLKAFKWRKQGMSELSISRKLHIDIKILSTFTEEGYENAKIRARERERVEGQKAVKLKQYKDSMVSGAAIKKVADAIESSIETEDSTSDRWRGRDVDLSTTDEPDEPDETDDDLSTTPEGEVDETDIDLSSEPVVTDYRDDDDDIKPLDGNLIFDSSSDYRDDDTEQRD